MVAHLIRLTWTIRRHTLGWKRRLGLVLGLVAAAGTWAATLLAGPDARADVLPLVLATWMAGWVVGPVLTSGAAVLRPEYFTLMPLSRRRLGAGLLASVFVGVGPLVTAAAVLAIAAHAVSSGADLARWLPAALLGIVGAALLLVLLVALSRTVYALLGAAMRSRLGVEIAAIQYGVLIAGMFAGWLVVSPALNAVPAFLRDGFADPAPGAVLGWMPTGWPVRMVEASLAGDHPAALGWLGALVLATGAVVAAAVALLTPHVGARTARRRVLARPQGSRRPWGLLPATPLGAVVGKELRSWWRDPWRSLELRSSIWFGLVLALIGLLADVPQLAILAGVAVALMVGLSGANLYGQDGTAMWQVVVAASPAVLRADIRGRQIAIVVALGTPAVVLSAVMIALVGEPGYALPVLAVLAALLGLGGGNAVLMSVLAVTPGVDPHRRVNATDAGENSLALGVSSWALLTLTAPTAMMGVADVLDAAWLPPWWTAATVALGVGEGLAGFWLGGALAIGYLRSHLPETFSRLRYPGTRITAAGGGLLGSFAHHAEEAAITERKDLVRRG